MEASRKAIMSSTMSNREAQSSVALARPIRTRAKSCAELLDRVRLRLSAVPWPVFRARAWDSPVGAQSFASRLGSSGLRPHTF